MNRQIVLSSIPEGMPSTDDFSIREAPNPIVNEGELLIKARYLSVDPYMRGRMRMNTPMSFILNEPLQGAGIGEVTESRVDEFKIGDLVKGPLLWQEFQPIKAKDVIRLGKYIHSPADYLGVLGLTGLTAYFGLQTIGKPVKGETVAISGAAGAVGIIAGQISRIKGCRVVGIAGSKGKINYLKEELQFDEAYDYHESDWENRLATAVPKGVDVYFDNVGGAVSDVILRHLNQRARIIICGQISLYNSTKPPSGPRVQPILLEKRALMQGFTVRDYDEHFNEAIEELSRWMKEGKLKSRETVFKGFEKLPEAFIGLFQGKNTGKCLVEL